MTEGRGPASSATRTLALALALSAATSPARADGFPISQVVEAIKSEINLARLASGPEERRLRITSVAITLTAVARTEGEAGIALEVPIVGELVGGAHVRVGAELASTQKIALTLTPMGVPEPVSGAASLGLAPAIQSVKAALREAARGPLAFGLDHFVFEAEFAVTKSAGGGVRFLFIDVAKAAGETVAMHRAAIHFKLAD